MLTIQRITGPGEDTRLAAQLFDEYARELGIDLQFQQFEKELDDPMKKYGPPDGALLLAYWNDTLAACVALQKLDDDNGVRFCEMKRLFVRPGHRKHAIGNALVDAIICEARKLGYDIMKLDTLKRLQPAIKLYQRKGFIETKPYYFNPIEDVVFMEKDLRPE
ncbi:GNAT family N-acetyltransferase [Danxiaibacter flavus]|uniref:GNAT family N-acetyltransferase n=1 Tax=Danxiaibacter flavus TaxID=3049108 RepID=A0ABV3ZGN5_9BACT|nr:GNAT family N-acetyltransferase [Chitinophagaceae bacterium DXS]